MSTRKNDKKVISLQEVKHKAETETRDLETKALKLGLTELLQAIDDGDVAGVAFAVEYSDGSLGTHHVTLNPHPSHLHMAASMLQQRMILEAICEGDAEDEEDED